MTMVAPHTHPLFDPAAPDLTLFWEDMPVGTRFRTSARTITESDVTQFAALTGDFNRMHVDREFAAASPYGQRIAHGLLVVSIMAGLATRTVANQMMEGALMGLLETRQRYLKPTFIDDTIHADIEVIEARRTSKCDRGLITFLRRAINQRGETAVEVENLMLFRRRDAR